MAHKPLVTHTQRIRHRNYTGSWGTLYPKWQLLGFAWHQLCYRQWLLAWLKGY